jgi:hypothetical protein
MEVEENEVVWKLMIGRAIQECDRAGAGPTYLSALPLNAVHDSLEGGIGEPTLRASIFVVFESSAESFGSVVEGISKRFVDRLDGLAAGHEDLLMYGLVERVLSEYLLLWF